MDIQDLFKPKIVVALLSIIILLNLAALFLYTRIDTIVHVDLYSHGLQFSSEWALEYWSNYGFFLSSLASAAILVSTALFAFYIHNKDKDELSRWMSILLTVIASGFIIFSVYFLFNIDWIVHHSLYQYGLQFNPEWAEGYWGITRATLALTVIAASFSIGTAIITWSTTGIKRKN